MLIYSLYIRSQWECIVNIFHGKFYLSPYVHSNDLITLLYHNHHLSDIFHWHKLSILLYIYKTASPDKLYSFASMTPVVPEIKGQLIVITNFTTLVFHLSLITWLIACHIMMDWSHDNPFSFPVSCVVNNPICQLPCAKVSIVMLGCFYCEFNSVASERYQVISVIFNHIIVYAIEMACMWTGQVLIGDKSTSIQVMAGCCQAPSHYLNQCWTSFMTQYVVIGPQWVKQASRQVVHWAVKLEALCAKHGLFGSHFGTCGLYITVKCHETPFQINTLRLRQYGCHLTDGIFKFSELKIVVFQFTFH